MKFKRKIRIGNAPWTSYGVSMLESLSSPLDLPLEEMGDVWDKVGRIIHAYRQNLPNLRVAPNLDLGAIRNSLAAVNFDAPKAWTEALAWIDLQMRDQQLHTGHPRYFGLFNPAPVPLAIAADALTAAYNPQLAAWSHSPFANELERYLIQQFGIRFGLPSECIDGTFCTGGAEANHTALVCALTARFPKFATAGVRALPGQPTIYISKFAHHSWIKAARACGLGSEAVRMVSCDASYRLDLLALEHMLRLDRQAGHYPVLLCGTAGTTNAGVIDPSLADRSKCWYHVDAAWGGAARFVPEFQHWLSGIEKADSITFDAHKFLSIPMGAGVFLTRHNEALSAAFRIATDYMPRDASSLAVIEPHAHSMQWSRRFIGLKIFLPLASAGWTGLASMIRQQCHLGARLRQMLVEDGWQCFNETPLPVVCVAPNPGDERPPIEDLAKAIVDSGLAWISTVQLDRPALRVCITNFQSTQRDLTELITILDSARIATNKATC